MSKFNARRYLDETFQSPQRARNTLLAFGFEAPSIPAVTKWFTRGSVPGEWLPLLLAAQELEQGKPVSVAGFVEAGGN